MHFLLIIAAFTAITLTLSERTYNFKIECPDGGTGCYAVPLHDSLDAKVFYAAVTASGGHLYLAVFCAVANHSDSSRFIDPTNFSSVSSGAISLTREPIVQHRRSASSIPGKYEIRPGADEDIVFVFKSEERYPKKKLLEMLKRDSFYFLHETAEKDTLFRLAADDKRLR